MRCCTWLNWQTAIKSWSGSASRPSLRWERPSPVYGLFRPILARAWAEGTRGGLNFVAFGKSFDAFEAQLKRMIGAEDGITDALFKFTSAISGSYLWCPPMRGKNLDLRALGL